MEKSLIICPGGPPRKSTWIVSQIWMPIDCPRVWKWRQLISKGDQRSSSHAEHQNGSRWLGSKFFSLLMDLTWVALRQVIEILSISHSMKSRKILFTYDSDYGWGTLECLVSTNSNLPWWLEWIRIWMSKKRKSKMVTSFNPDNLPATINIVRQGFPLQNVMFGTRS